MTPKQQRFVEEYLIDLNAARAYRAAGYRGSDNVCAVEGHRLLSNPKVGKAIAALKAARSERTKIDADWLLSRLAAEATADINDLYDEHGAIKPVKDWPPIWRQGLVAGLEVEEVKAGGKVVAAIRKVKLSDRVKRLELIGRHIDVGAFKDRVEHGLTPDAAKLIEAGMSAKEAADRYREELG